MPDSSTISGSYLAILTVAVGMLDEEPVYRRVRRGELVIERYDGTRVPTELKRLIDYYAS